MMDMAAYLSDQRDALREALDCAVRREAIVATKLAEAREERDQARHDRAAMFADLEQVRSYIEDALLCDDDLGLIRDVLHAALDVGR